MVKDGDDIWFTADNAVYYANLTSDEVVLLVNDDVFYVNIIGDELLVSKSGLQGTGLSQIGAGLPTTANQTVTPLLLNETNQVGWFVRTDKYAYYTRIGSVEESALVRCDPNTWKPLYSITTRADLYHYVVFYNNDTDISIIGTLYEFTTNRPLVALYSDNGVEITTAGLFMSADNTTYYKISSMTPTHCGNKMRDFDETDIDCGGSLCIACPGSSSKSFNNII